MIKPKKRKRSLVLDSNSPLQHQQELSILPIPAPSFPCQPHSTVPGQAPKMPPHTLPAEPQDYKPTTNSPTAPEGSEVLTSSKYERILPKRLSAHPPSGTWHSSLHPYQSLTFSQADEREKARKVSHSATERRRRERINDKIMQLKNIIPTCADQDNLHKLSILQSAIDYIQYLKNLVDSSTVPEHQNIDPSPPFSDSLVTDPLSLAKNRSMKLDRLLS